MLEQKNLSKTASKNGCKRHVSRFFCKDVETHFGCIINALQPRRNRAGGMFEVKIVQLEVSVCDGDNVQ